MKNQPLYRQIQQTILNDIRNGQLRPGDLVPSERDLASTFHVSSITVKNAIMGLVEQGVVHRIKGKGTFVDPKFQLDTTNHQGELSAVALILPTMMTKIDQEILNYIELFLAQQGLNVFVRITREDPDIEASSIVSFREKGVQGLIIFPTESENYSEAILRLTLDKFPVVLVDRYLKNTNTCSVSSDNVRGTYDAITYLLKKGYRRIAYITPQFTNSATIDRREGLERAFVDRNLSIDRNLWCTLELNRLSPNLADQDIADFLARNQDIESIFTVNSFLANRTLHVLKGMNKCIPNDVELVSFDKPESKDIPYVAQDEEEICRRAVELLIEQLNGSIQMRRIVVPTKLVLPSHNQGNMHPSTTFRL